MDVHSAAGLAHGNLGGEAYIQASLVCEVADNPFGQYKLVCGRFHGAGEELNLVLLPDFSVEGEVANLGVAVLYLAARFRYVEHTLAAEIVHLGEGFALVVAFLVSGREQGFRLLDHVVFQFSHSLELEAGGLFKGLLRPHKGGVGGAVELPAVLVIVAAKEAEGGLFLERVYESGPVAGKYVKVTVAGLYEGREQAGAVHAFSFDEDRLYVVEAVYREIQGFDAAVFRWVHKVHHTDAVFRDVAEDVLPGEFLRAFPQVCYYLVGAECNLFVHSSSAKTLPCGDEGSVPGARYESRTRDLRLGKPTLYQLS